MPVVRNAFRLLFSLLFVGAGINHFANPQFYLRMMPPYLPLHAFLVQASGVCEIALGLLLAWPRTSRVAGYGLIALLIAVFPANIHMATHTQDFPEFSPFGLYFRLPIQGLLIWWAYIYTKPDPPRVTA